MKKIVVLHLPLLFVLFNQTFSQVSTNYFAANLQTKGAGAVTCSQRNGKFIYVGGASFNTAQTVNIPSIMKLDTAGNTIWTISAPYRDGVIQQMVVDDSGVYARTTGTNEIWKVDLTYGNIVWKKSVADAMVLALVDDNRIAYTYNSENGYTYELVDKATGKTVFSKLLSGPMQYKNNYNFSFDKSGATYATKGDSIIKYSSPTLESVVWSAKVNGGVWASQPQPDGLYFYGIGSYPFCGKIDASSGNTKWFTYATADLYYNFLSDFVSDFKVTGDYVYMSGQHFFYGSVYSAYRICKFNKNTGEKKWEKFYNPNWGAMPTTNGGYYAINSFDVDSVGNVYSSGYEQGNDWRLGNWGVCKFDSNGVVKYHNLMNEGVEDKSGSSAGVYSFVYDNKVFHLGNVNRNFNLCVTDTSGTFKLLNRKNYLATFRYPTSVLDIAKITNDKYAVFKQLGDSVAVELRSSRTSGSIWEKKFGRAYFFEADKMCITSDNKIAFSAIAHPMILTHAWSAVPDSVFFIKLDTLGNLVYDKKNVTPPDNIKNFKPIGLYALNDTNIVYQFMKSVDYWPNYYGFHFLRIQSAIGSVTDRGAYIGPGTDAIPGRQSLFLPFKDSTLRFRADPALDIYYVSPGGMSRTERSYLTNLGITPTNLANCDDSTVIVLGKGNGANYRIGRFNVPARTPSWVKDEMQDYTIDMATCSKNYVYTTGRNNANLVISRMNIKDGTASWKKLIAPALAGQYYIPLDQKFNAYKNQYTVVGYIVDSSNASLPQSAFYITVDTSGQIINKWVSAGDYAEKNSLNAVEITQFGQTLVVGTISNNDFGSVRCGILIATDSVGYPPSTLSISMNPATPVCNGDTVTLTASSPGCVDCSYLWEANHDSAGATLKVTASGSYKVKAFNKMGTIQNTQTVVIKETPNKPTITKQGNILTSSAASGNQWFVNQTIINGATGVQFKADTSGLYAVQVNGDGCLSKMSDTVRYVVPVIIDTIPSVAPDTAFSVYPNPVVNNYNIINRAAKQLNITFYNSAGSVVYNVESREKKIVVNLESFSRGIYYVMIVDEKTGNKTIKRIMKQ
ncbi:PQQ-binding-like beta-propeller repeat protein [Chitinophagaceae bacterium 26-R-25]|nr:PQQ-binding-like beta-propeller repeat protein [Chitinophagaceae bacterium 26-R-25]